MVRQGPIPAFVHGLLEYVWAVLLIAAPFLFSYHADGTATAVSVVAGVIVLLITAASALPTGLIKSIPVHAHVVLDYILAGLLIAAPFIFSFNADGTPTALFIALGVVHLLLTIATRYLREPRRSRRENRSSQPTART